MPRTTYEVLLELSGSEEFRSGIQGITSATQALGGLLTATGASLTALIGLGANINREVETNLALVGTVTRSSGQSLDQFNEALSVTLDRTNNLIPRSEALTSTYDIASAGFQDASDNAAVLEAILLSVGGSTATVEDVTKATLTTINAYSKELEAFGGPGEQALKIQDGLNQAVADGVTTTAELASQYTRVIPAAAGLGVSLDEVNAAFAAATKGGQSTEQAATGLTQALAAIGRGGASAEAREAIEELGIKFSAADLAADGLTGVLQSLTEAGLTSFDSVLELTGSVEAANTVVTLLANNTENFTAALENQANAAGITQQNFDDLAQTFDKQLANALNSIQELLSQLATGFLPAATKILEALNFILDSINELPQPLKTTLGIIVGLGGAGLTTAGAILFLAGTLGSLSTGALGGLASLKKLQAALVGTEVTTKLLGNTALAAGVKLKSLAASSVALAKALAPLVAVVAAVQLGIKDYQNQLDELEATQQRIAGNALQPAIGAVTRAVTEARATGEAIPTEKLKELNRLLNETKQTANLSAEDLKTLEKVQRSLSSAYRLSNQGLLDQETSLDAAGAQTAELTSKLKEQSDATEELEEQKAQLLATIEREATVARERLDLAEAELEQQVAEGQLNETDAIQARLAAERDFTQEQIKLQRALVRSSLTTTEERESAERRISTLLAEEGTKRAEALKQIREIQAQEAQSFFDAQQSALERAIALEELTEEEASLAQSQLRDQRLRDELARINQEIQATADGSLARQRLIAEGFRVEAELAQNAADFRESLIQNELDTLQGFFEFRRTEEQRLADLITGQTGIQSTGISTGQSFVGDLESVLQSIESFRSGAADEEGIISSQDAERLERMESAALGLARQLRDAGILTGNLSSVSDAQLAIQRAQLDLKFQEIELQRQQLENEQAITRLEQESLILEQQALLRSGTLGDDESRLAEARIRAAQQTLQLLEQETELRQRNLDLQEAIVGTQATVDAVAGGGPAPNLANARSRAQESVALPQLSELVSKELGDLTTGAREALGEGIEKQTESLASQQQQFLDSFNQGQAAQFEPLQTALSETIPTSVQQVEIMTQQQLSALGGQLTQINQSIVGAGDRIVAAANQISNQVSALPGAIARSIPRPAPPARSN